MTPGSSRLLEQIAAFAIAWGPDARAVRAADFAAALDALIAAAITVGNNAARPPGIDALIARSSLGAPDVVALRARTSPGLAARIAALAALPGAEDQPCGPLTPAELVALGVVPPVAQPRESLLSTLARVEARTGGHGNGPVLAGASACADLGREEDDHPGA